MKSLKRTLSLVLALVMVLGLFGGISMTAAASEFTDDKDIQYKEAVDVMTAIGTIKGYEEAGGNSFKPEGTITRAEAATMVARTVLGYDVVMSSDVKSSFTDVNSNYDWAIPSIEYLVGINVINGMGDGTFDPDGEISGYAIMKMLLCCLGYGAKGEYTGDGWMLKTSVDANKVKLTEDWDGNANNMSEAATREEVALFCFNTIQRPKVTYSEVLKEYIHGGFLGEDDNNGWLGTDATIMRDVYPKLKDIQITSDAAGRPGTRWELDNKLIGEYADKAAYTFTKKLTAAEAGKAFRGFKVDENVKIMIDGTEGIALTADNLADEIVDKSGNGTLLQVYVSGATTVTAVVVTHTDLAKIEKINATSKTVTLRGNNSGKVYTVGSDSKLYSVLTAKKVDDYVLMQHVGKTVTDIADPTVVTGKLTAIGTSSGNVVSVTVDGSSYSVAALQTKISGTGGLSLTDVNEKKDVTLYVDTYGNAIFIEDVVASSSYMMIIRIDQTLVDNKVVNLVSGYTSTGELVTINNGNDQNDAYGIGLDTFAEGGRIYEYKPANPTQVSLHSREYMLTPCDVPTTDVKPADGQCTPNAEAIEFAHTTFLGQYKSGTWANLTDDSDHRVPYASDVKFIFITESGVTVKTGVQKVAANKAWALCENTDSGLVITAVYVGAAPVNDAQSILYLTKSTGSVTENNVTLYTYEAYVDGEKVDGGIKTKTQVELNNFYAYSEKDGVWDLSAYGANGGKPGVSKATLDMAEVTAIQADYIMSATYSLADDAVPVTGLKAAGAQVIDLSGTDTDRLEDIVKAFNDGKTVIVSMIYDDLIISSTQKSVKYIYVIAVADCTATITSGSVITPTGSGNGWILRANATDTASISFDGFTKNITYRVSSDVNVVKVSSSNIDATSKVVMLEVVGEGTATITLTLDDDTTYKFTVKVEKKPA